MFSSVIYATVRCSVKIGSGDEVAAKRRLSVIEKIPILETTVNATKLAKALIAERAIPESSTEDALYIGIAAVQNIDFLLTWNFKHINNANTREKISKIITQWDYTCPVLCSPEELINDRCPNC